ncbi:hypothetical protein F7725_018215 [Dissostichus mawsoni]|uniref:Pyrin domain-containing protein n=1 Tax=Dissostichus mawsoni TaxID=36200 RepID=A0A7J5XTR7_DISMA|nr:hypothetical protein F7725_018215 [Dissostichus mawsoni]
MVRTFSRTCVNMNKTVLKKMNRTDLVETMASVIELLLETLKDLTDQELQRFQRVLLIEIQSDKGYPDISPSQHRLLEMTTEAFERMNRTDLVERLSQSSSGPKTTMLAVKHLLLETLNDLRNEDLEKFKQTLDLIVSKKKPRYFH